MTMEQETCEKIINSIQRILKSDKNLDEFDVIFSTGDTNQSPVIHIEHKLAVESWCVKHIYLYAHSKLHPAKLHPHGNDTANILKYTQICLIFKPEVTTHWNMRRKILSKHKDRKSDEVLTRLILSYKPKCLEAYCYRRWILSRDIFKTFDSPIEIERVWDEFNFCSKTASMKENNYHSWNHRLELLNALQYSYGYLQEIYVKEYETMRNWIDFHVSEYSGMHYMVELLRRICCQHRKKKINLQESFDVSTETELYMKQLDHNTSLMQHFSGHEALFYFRKAILLQLFNYIGGCQKESSPPSPAIKRCCVEVTNSKWEAILRKELEFTVQLKVTMQSMYFLNNYVKWLNAFYVNK